MVTQYINISRTGVTQLYLNASIVVTTQSNCMGTGCLELMAVKTYQTNEIDESGRSDQTRYSDSLSFEATGVEAQQDGSLAIPVSKPSTGLYLAILATSSQKCVAISRLAVFYYVCPEQERNLVKYPEIIAPASSDELSKMAEATCVDNAVPASSPPPEILKCMFKGVWTSTNVSCECEKGFFVPSQSSRPFCQGKCY